jgi:hypothetical protein
MDNELIPLSQGAANLLPRLSLLPDCHGADHPPPSIYVHSAPAPKA